MAWQNFEIFFGQDSYNFAVKSCKITRQWYGNVLWNIYDWQCCSQAIKIPRKTLIKLYGQRHGYNGHFSNWTPRLRGSNYLFSRTFWKHCARTFRDLSEQSVVSIEQQCIALPTVGRDLRVLKLFIICIGIHGWIPSLMRLKTFANHFETPYDISNNFFLAIVCDSRGFLCVFVMVFLSKGFPCCLHNRAVYNSFGSNVCDLPAMTFYKIVAFYFESLIVSFSMCFCVQLFLEILYALGVCVKLLWPFCRGIL